MLHPKVETTSARTWIYFEVVMEVRYEAIKHPSRGGWDWDYHMMVDSIHHCETGPVVGDKNKELFYLGNTSIWRQMK